MDRRSFCKVLGFAAGSTLLPGLMVQAAGQGSVGHAVPDGRYTIGIRSDLSGCDLTHAFYYSDSFFTHPATQYDHQLALATLGLVCAAANTVASDAEYWVNGSVGREAHIAAAYETLGFEDALFYNYDLDTGRAGDFVGYSLARKTLTLNDQRTTLVALVLRGGGYGGEWASNFHTGDTSAHTGFVTPVAAVFASLKAYLARAGQGGAFKLWLGGYSRGSIIANLLAAKIARELPQLGRENIYAYGFAVPAALTAADRPDLQQDFDANHAPDGTLLENIALGEEEEKIDRRRAEESLRAARLEDFVQSLSAGIDTPIGEAGNKLSGGQRQRIGIARALYKQANILFFDEATSALDSGTEEGINRSIAELSQHNRDLTIVVIAHRESSLEYCDRIITLDNNG